MFTLTKGQHIKLNHDVEIWNEDDSLAARIEAGTLLEVQDICSTPEDGSEYWNVDIKVISSVYDGYTTNLDLEADDLGI